MKEASYSHAGRRSPGVMPGRNSVLVHRDGHRVAFLEEGTDERGEYLVIEHVWTRPGTMAGPHWHPVLTESFRVREGRMRFRVDGREFELGPGDDVTVRPGEVHRFWNEGEGHLRVVHEVRPPGHHREMFELWHRLDLAGKTNRRGMPRDPLALGLLWELQDGYLAGVPASVQRFVFGGLARLARSTGYEERLERLQPKPYLTRKNRRNRRSKS
jgi:mannose-6-phosphate isomerase-like protein (cupin superfamily)